MNHEPWPPSQQPGQTTSEPLLLSFLLNPKSYPHRPRSVQLLQTHASFVFIAPPFVYKVKKPVEFGFLNFSTLEKRQDACEREVTLNRRLSSGVYLGVVPISVRDGRLTLGPGDAVVEYAVKMRRLASSYFLDHLLERGKVMPVHLDRIAVVLKDFYLAQHPSREVTAWGRVDRLRISTDENFRQTRGFIGQTLSRPAFEAVRSYTRRFYASRRHLFASRVRDQWIRDCHGDLHLDHIHITPRALHIYDCIEFNDRFRHVDVASDAAFLAMDLDYQGRPELARYFARRMAAELKDDGMPLLMDFYKCYRAYVRGKVESLHSIARAAPEEERDAAAERARRYFQLALQYTVAGSQPLVLVVMGRIASGKSTLARALGDELGWEVISSDRLRKTTAGLPLYERTRAALRKRLYSATMTNRIYGSLIATAETRIKAGHSLILDATFAQREHRARLARRFAKRGIAWRVLETRAANAVAKRRLHSRETRPAEVSDARLEDFDRLNRLYEPPLELEDGRLVKARTSGPLHQVVTKALQNLAQIQTRSACPPPQPGMSPGGSA